MKKILVLAAALALAASSCAFALPVVLTEPQKSGGPRRIRHLRGARFRSGAGFYEGRADARRAFDDTLWAATGQNGTESWTVPVIMGRDP